MGRHQIFSFSFFFRFRFFFFFGVWGVKSISQEALWLADATVWCTVSIVILIKRSGCTTISQWWEEVRTVFLTGPPRPRAEGDKNTPQKLDGQSHHRPLLSEFLKKFWAIEGNLGLFFLLFNQEWGDNQGRKPSLQIDFGLNLEGLSSFRKTLKTRGF